MMEKKEFYRHMLPHFQQPGQAYFVTWNLNDAIPHKVLERYTQHLETIKLQICDLTEINSNLIKNNCESESAAPNHCAKKSVVSMLPEMIQLRQEYNLIRKKYLIAYNDLLDTAINPSLDLSREVNTNIIIQALRFWDRLKLKNIAFSIMPNHVHWVFELFEKDEEGNPVYLQDVMQSVKRHSSNQINIAENRKGRLWQKESFDTTIRDEKHLYYAIRYTLNNPVKAGLIGDWREWKGNWYRCSDF